MFERTLIGRKLKPRFSIRKAILLGFIKVEQRVFVAENSNLSSPIDGPLVNRNRVLGKKRLARIFSMSRYAMMTHLSRLTIVSQ